MKNEKYILWLPSWYPNEREPFNGDFIQRHARAAAMHDEITVIFFTAFGERVDCEFKTEEKKTGNLKELIVYVPFRPSANRMWDRVRYNVQFYRFAHKFLRRYFREHGLPTLVHVHVPVKAGNLAIWIKKKFGIAYVVSEQASTYLEQAPDSFFKRHFLYRWQVRKIFSGAAMVTNVSQTVLAILKKLFLVKKSMVIPNVVDTGIFKWDREKNSVFTFIHVSSLNEQKNITGILTAFRRLAEIRRDWKLVLVGPYSDAIRNFIQMEGLQNLVELTGEVSYPEVAVQMRRAHVKVLFSRHENFPCVVVEALCCGLPVVSSDVAGVCEAVNSSNGLLVGLEDQSAFLGALVSIRESYGKYDTAQIASDASMRFGYNAVAMQFEELYKCCLLPENGSYLE